MPVIPPVAALADVHGAETSAVRVHARSCVRNARMRSWCAAARASVSDLVTIPEQYASLASVRGIQKCGSESILAVLAVSSGSNSFNIAASISCDREKDPRDGPTVRTSPNVARSRRAVS